jgi:amino acid transporter
MRRLKAITDSLVPITILVGLIGVETTSKITQYLSVLSLGIILIIQIICYAYNKTN